jgi:AcrR family transcriptional regulator
VKKQPEITARTRENLMEAFWEFYRVKRIDKITVKEITTKAGYNRSTFYAYFSDVDDVLKQIEDSLLPKPADFPPLTLHGIPTNPLPIDAFIRVYEKHKKYYRVLFGDSGDPSFQSKLKNSVKLVIKQRLDSQKMADSTDLDITVEFMLSAMIGVLGYWFRLENPPESDELLKVIYELMHHGVMHKLAL